MHGIAVAWIMIDRMVATIVVTTLHCPENQEKVLYVIVGIRDTGTE